MTKGYTLIEVVVVLALLALATALVAPAFVTSNRSATASAGVISQARALAIRRAEALELRIEPSGAWQLDGIASAQAGALATGMISPAPGVPITLVFSPLGSCAPNVATAASIHLDPLTCEGTP